MNNIEEYIKQNKHEFDVLEPQKNHFDKMKLRLGYSNNNKIKAITVMFRYASVFLVLLITAYFVFFNSRNNNQCLPDNFRETQNYYARLISQKTNELQLNKLPKDEQQIINNELVEMDSLYNVNIKDICNNPENDFVINSLVKHYEIKLKVINKILFRLNQAKKTKTNNVNYNM